MDDERIRLAKAFVRASADGPNTMVQTVHSDPEHRHALIDVAEALLAHDSERADLLRQSLFAMLVLACAPTSTHESIVKRAHHVMTHLAMLYADVVLECDDEGELEVHGTVQ